MVKRLHPWRTTIHASCCGHYSRAAAVASERVSNIYPSRRKAVLLLRPADRWESRYLYALLARYPSPFPPSRMIRDQSCGCYMEAARHMPVPPAVDVFGDTGLAGGSAWLPSGHGIVGSTG